MALPPRSPRNLPDMFENETTTQVLVPRRTAHRPASPPRARLSREAELPPVMVAQDPWNTRTQRMSRPLPSVPPPDFDARRAPTQVLKVRPSTPPPARHGALVLAGAAFALGVLTLYMFPVFARLVDGALAFVR